VIEKLSQKILAWSKIKTYLGGEDGPVFAREDKFYRGGENSVFPTN
jgi:hypothetical protein